MDTLDQALLDFWGKLNYFKVKYLMVGGLATRFHGFNRQTDDINPHKVPFIHINHLIANKKAVNRPKDQIDVIELEAIKRITENKQI